MRILFLVLALAACATAPRPDAANLPSRAALQDAVTDSDHGCQSLAVTDSSIDCNAVPDRVVTVHRCRADLVPDQPTRVFCRYRGTWSWRYLERHGSFGECAWLTRTEWGWRIDGIPDDVRVCANM
jgi:hypothetical protein